MEDIPPEYEAKAQAEILSTARLTPPLPPAPSSSSNSKTHSHIVALKHCKPGHLNKRGKVTTGPLIEEIGDAITLSDDLKFDGLVDLLNKRVERRFEMCVNRAEFDRSAIALKVDGKPVNVVDDASWKAAKAVMDRSTEAGSDVELAYYFAQVPMGWTGPAKKGAKCVVM